MDNLVLIRNKETEEENARRLGEKSKYNKKERKKERLEIEYICVCVCVCICVCLPKTSDKVNF